MKKILIVDDHGIIRTGLKIILKEIIFNFEFFEASNKEEAIEILKKTNDLDLIVLDVNIPDYSCERMIESCKIRAPKAKIMILTMNSESMMARRFYKLGVDAFVNKGSDEHQLKKALTELINNKRYFSPDLLVQLANDTFYSSTSPINPFESLSTREFEVMCYLFEGKNIQEISYILSIHPSSIGTYKSRIFDKMKVENVIELYDLFNAHNK
jgi:DNA-binding NarL/FixJ family response regulator